MKLILVAGLGGAIGSTLSTALSYGDNTSTRLGMVTHSPKFNKLNIDFDDFDEFVIAGWDVNKANMINNVYKHACVPNQVVSLSETQLQKIQIRSGLIPHKTIIDEWFSNELAWLETFRSDNNITSTVIVNLCSTEPIVIECHTDWSSISSLKWSNPSVAVSRLYFRFAIESGAHFINFTPNFCEIEPLTTMAKENGLLYSGRDGKTGQTFLKTLLAPAFRDKNFRIDGWFSTNILGNSDGRTLADSSNAKTKINSKRECLSEILGYNPGDELSEYSHQINIHYYPPRGDAKEAWDNIDFSGMFNQKMQLKLNWLGWDSILAAPAVLDLIRLTFLAESFGIRGLLDNLGYFYKTPLSQVGQEKIHDIDLQYARLINWVTDLKSRAESSKCDIEYDAWGWPKWPQTARLSSQALKNVLHNGTWAISGERISKHTEEELFCKEFSDFIGMSYGVACSSGSSALTIALEAAGIGFGDKVLLPPSPWVACASAVLSVGGIPVFCDLNPDNLCMCPEQAELMINSDIKAILLVHSLCSIADVSAFVHLAKKWDIPLIEDCSQAHGASFNGQKIGSFGDFSVFSMQQTKVLSSGEGGIVLCKDIEHYELLQQLRADGRVWSKSNASHSFHLDEKGQVQGYNYCLSELQSSILRNGLKYLTEDNKRRTDNALLLNDFLSNIHGVKTYFRSEKNHQPSIYEYCISLPVSSADEISIIANNLTKLLGVRVFSFDLPIYRHQLFQPQLCRRFPTDHIKKVVAEANVRLQVVEKLVTNSITFPHRLFIGKNKCMKRISDAILAVLQ